MDTKSQDTPSKQRDDISEMNLHDAKRLHAFGSTWYDWHLSPAQHQGVLDVLIRLQAALEELLDVTERMHGGDPTLDPEQWYAVRDYARSILPTCRSY